MIIIDFKQVCKITGYSERTIQYAYKGDYKKKPILPSYKVVGGRIFITGKWEKISPKFRKNRMVFEKKEVLQWLQRLVE